MDDSNPARIDSLSGGSRQTGKKPGGAAAAENDRTGLTMGRAAPAGGGFLPGPFLLSAGSGRRHGRRRRISRELCAAVDNIRDRRTAMRWWRHFAARRPEWGCFTWRDNDRSARRLFFRRRSRGLRAKALSPSLQRGTLPAYPPVSVVRASSCGQA